MHVLVQDANDNLQKRLAAAEVGLIQASALNSSMAAEGRASGVRLRKAESAAKRAKIQLSTAMAMTRAKVRVLPWSRAYPRLCPRGSSRIPA